MNRFFLIFVFLILIHPVKSQESVETNFTTANAAYEQKDFQEAIKNYEAILTTGTQSAELFYNLANSYYQQGAIGKAILYYEKSLLISNDENTRYNLEIARTQQVDQLSSVGSTPRQWWNNMVCTFSANTWTIGMILLLWGTIIGWVLWLIGKERTHRKRGFMVGIIGIPLVLLTAFIANTSNDLEKNSRRAILLEKEIALRISPDSKGKILNTLHEGVELNLLEELNDWYHVRLINGDQGWLPETSFEKI